MVDRGRLEICCPSSDGPWVRIPPSPICKTSKLILIFVLFLVLTGLVARNSYADNASRSAQPTRHEVYAFVGNYFGDREFTHGGWRVSFPFFRTSWTRSHIFLHEGRLHRKPLLQSGGFFTNDNLYGFDLTGQYTFPTSINFGEHQLDLDLFILLGAGTVQINDAYEPHGVIGGGFKIYTNKPWLALRMDMRGTMHTTNKPGGANEFDQDLLLCLGVSFQIPPQL